MTMACVGIQYISCSHHSPASETYKTHDYIIRKLPVHSYVEGQTMCSKRRSKTAGCGAFRLWLINEILIN